MPTEIWIYAHWLSCNMGDRYQSRALVRYLNQRMDLRILARSPLEKQVPFRFVFVNFSKDIHPMNELIDGDIYPVYSPEDVIDRQPNLVILLTGSIDYTTKFIPWLRRIVEITALDQIIIWGGFSHGRREGIHREGLSILKHPKITFWSRSWRDADMYEEWFDRPSRLGGDPMGFWIFKEGPIIKSGCVVIVSVYAYNYFPDEWTQLINDADRVISIDNVADRELHTRFPQIEFITNPEELIPILRGADRVISGRLHSGLLASLLKRPTIMVVTDNSNPGEGTYKFEAVARTGCGIDKPLCSISSPLQLTLPKKEEIFFSDDYLSLTDESFRLLLDSITKLY